MFSLQYEIPGEMLMSQERTNEEIAKSIVREYYGDCSADGILTFSIKSALDQKDTLWKARMGERVVSEKAMRK